MDERNVVPEIQESQTKIIYTENAEAIVNKVDNDGIEEFDPYHDDHDWYE